MFKVAPETGATLNAFWDRIYGLWERNIFLVMTVLVAEAISVTFSQGCRSLLSIAGDNLQFCPIFYIGGDEPRPRFFSGSGYFASEGKIAPCYFAIWRQNSPNGYFAASAKIALILTQTLTLIPTLTLTQTGEKHYFASRGKIASSFFSVEQIKWRPKKKVFAKNETLFFPEFIWRPKKKSLPQNWSTFPEF